MAWCKPVHSGNKGINNFRKCGDCFFYYFCWNHVASYKITTISNEEARTAAKEYTAILSKLAELLHGMRSYARFLLVWSLILPGITSIVAHNRTVVFFSLCSIQPCKGQLVAYRCMQRSHLRKRKKKGIASGRWFHVERISAGHRSKFKPRLNSLCFSSKTFWQCHPGVWFNAGPIWTKNSESSHVELYGNVIISR